MRITRTKSELLNTYQRLKHTAETLDQSALDTNKREDYVTVNLERSAGEGSEQMTGTHTLNSFPSVSTKAENQGLISRSTTIKSFNIEETQFAQTSEGPHQHKMSFTDDGRTLRVTESLTSLAEDSFLASEEQSYIIYQKSGKMRTLKAKSSGPLEL